MTSQNVLIAFSDYMDGVEAGLLSTPSMSGGSWQLTADVKNLTSRFFAHRARSNGCSLGATKFVIDLKQPRPVYVVAIPKHNGTKNAIVTTSIYSDAALTNLVASVVTEVSPVIYPFGSLPFGHPSWWDGKASDEEFAFLPPPILAVFGSNIVGRYVLVEINDQANPAGYFEICRPIVAPGYQPTINFAYNATLQVEDPTIITTTLGGARLPDKRVKTRKFHGTLPYLDSSEALANIFIMHLTAGTSLRGFFSMNPSDTVNLAKHSFAATFSQLDPFVSSFLNCNDVGISIQEVVA